jgi:hypothetical protein
VDGQGDPGQLRRGASPPNPDRCPRSDADADGYACTDCYADCDCYADADADAD